MEPAIHGRPGQGAKPPVLDFDLPIDLPLTFFADFSIVPPSLDYAFCHLQEKFL